MYPLQNKEQLLPYTALSDRFLKERWRMFTARYELGLQLKQNTILPRRVYIYTNKYGFHQNAKFKSLKIHLL